MPDPGRLRRAPHARIYDRVRDGEDTLTVLGGGASLTVLGGGASTRLSGDSAALARAVLAYLRAPRTRDEVVAHVAELTGVRDRAPLAIVDELLALLRRAGAVVEARDVASAPQRALGRAVLAVCGGIAAAYAPAVVELLLAEGAQVRVAATPDALRFVAASALEALTHARVASELWPADPRDGVPHLELAAWADLVVVCPATATTLARIATGDASTLVSAIAIGARCPVLLVPAMNASMYDAPSVQRNLATLREDGFVIAHPSFGFEVAETPSARAPSFGAAPPVQAVVEIARDLLQATRSDPAPTTG